MKIKLFHITTITTLTLAMVILATQAQSSDRPDTQKIVIRCPASC